MEYWNTGILGIKAEINHFKCEKFLQTHYSNWDEAKKFILHDIVFFLKSNCTDL